MTDYDERAPYTLVLGNTTSDCHLKYKGEVLPGLVASAVTVGAIGDHLDFADGERAHLLVKIRMQYVRLERDEATLHGGEIEIDMATPRLAVDEAGYSGGIVDPPRVVHIAPPDIPEGRDNG